ncbi:MAG: tryptophanase [Bacteroidota bacterium]
MSLPYIEPYKIKMVEAIHLSTREEREKWIEQAQYNLFNLKSDQVTIDLLTDSGTGAMSDEQWSALMRGDESYAGSRSFDDLKTSVHEILGFSKLLPTHQGRAAENVLFSALVEEGDLVPGNAHFDTTKGHIEFRNARAIDCTIAEASDPTVEHPFKGNVDTKKLEQVIEEERDRIPFVIMTLTCNSVGGQPVSMKNIREVARITRSHGLPLIMDGARYAENAWFIHQREDDYQDASIEEIIREQASYFDAMTMSSKKDGLVNMGGFIALRDEDLYQELSVYGILFEGFTSYGGMSGRDMAALAQGLRESAKASYLESRIRQVQLLGEQLDQAGVPILKPVGGHAVYLDANKILPHLPRDQYRAQTLAIELYIESGIRGVEIGTLLADRDPDTGENRYPDLELVRLTIPRRVYTSNHMNYVGEAVKAVYQRREQIQGGLEIVDEAPILRHFTVKLDRVSQEVTY